MSVCCLLLSLKTATNDWIKKTGKAYNLNYTAKDRPLIKEYEKLIETGMHEVAVFFDSSFAKKFEVYIHPDRRSLDSSWRKDWNMPGFTSECWMVASGVAARIDIISPKTWDTASCEHSYSNKEKMQQLITHELVHVFHGQQNISPDFSKAENIDWFVEGLATYASGQLDSASIAKVKEQVRERTYPKTLDIFWTGKLRYGLSGSMLMFIDKNYDRTVLKSLMKFNTKKQILDALQTTEQDLLAGWAKYLK